MLPWFFVLTCLTFGLTLSGKEDCHSIEEASIFPFSQQKWEIAFEALKKMNFKGSERVLDIGCGNGKIAAHIAGRVPQGSVLGLELCRGMLAFAEKTYLPFYPNLSFVNGDILDFSPPHKFDLIFSSSSLHWIQDHLPLLVQANSLLEDQGVLLFTIPGSPSFAVADIFRDITLQEPWEDYLSDYYHPRRKMTADEYTALLKLAGFRKIEVLQVPFTYYFETKREFADWFAAYSLMISYIPVELRKRFLTNLADRYLESFPLDRSGRLVFNQNELIIRAQK